MTKTDDVASIKTAATLNDAIAHYVALHREYEAARLAFEGPGGIKGRRSAAKEALWERMKDEGVPSIKLDGIGRVTRNEPTWFASVQDRGALQRWAQENRPGLLRVVEEEGLLNKLVREYIDDERELPPGLAAYPRYSVSVNSK